MAEYNDDSIDIHTNQSAGEDEEDEEQSSQESPYHNPLDQSVGAANHLKHQRLPQVVPNRGDRVLAPSRMIEPSSVRSGD